jgi:predicted phosphate transport protein (TIGR00153 family)
MKFSIKPKNSKFFDLYKNPTEKIFAAAKILRKMSYSTIEENRRHAKEIGKLERGADEDRKLTMKAIVATFITPFDREDLHELASEIEDCMDYIDDASELMLVMNIKDYPGRVEKMLKIVEQQADLADHAMKHLDELTSLSNYWEETRYLEHKADKLRRSMMTTLFEDEKDPIRLLKLKEITEQLELIINQFESIADMLENIALREM